MASIVTMEVFPRMARTLSVSSVSGSSRNRGVLLLAALFGVLSAGLMFAFLSNRGNDSADLEAALTTAGGAESVVVVTRNILVGEKITSDMLTTKPVPATALLAGRVTNPEGLIGKVAVAPLYAGEQVIESKVTTFVGQITLAYKVPEGMRALSLQIPHEAWVNSGLIQPGDRVDVLGITTLMKTDPLTGEEKPNVIAGLIAQDVEVLAVAQTTVKVIPNVDGKLVTVPSTGDAAPTVVARSTVTSSGAQLTDPKAKPGDDAAHYELAISITLALPPDLAAKVAILDAMKDDMGQYRLIARQKGDTTRLTGTLLWNFDEIFPKK